MKDNDETSFIDLAEFWASLCAMQKQNGDDLPQIVKAWAEAKRESLQKWTADSDFDELCKAGCHPIALGIALWTIEASKSALRKWQSAIGSARRRDQIIRSLTHAADVLEEVNEKFITAALNDLGVSIDPAIRKAMSADPSQMGRSNFWPEWPSSAPVPHPATTVRALRLYAKSLGFFQVISQETEANSADSFPKYLISAYVRRATGDFHDRQVSALFGSSAKRESYDETAHRMWRRRNYKKLEKSFGLLADLLHGIGVVTL